MRFKLMSDEAVHLVVSVEDALSMNESTARNGFLTRHGGVYILGRIYAKEGSLVAELYQLEWVPDQQSSGEEA